MTMCLQDLPVCERCGWKRPHSSWRDEENGCPGCAATRELRRIGAWTIGALESIDVGLVKHRAAYRRPLVSPESKILPFGRASGQPRERPPRHWRYAIRCFGTQWVALIDRRSDGARTQGVLMTTAAEFLDRSNR